MPSTNGACSEIAPGSGSLPLRQLLDLRAFFLLGEAEFVELLQVQPEIGAGAEPVPEPQRRIRSDRALLVQDAGDAVRRNVELPRQLGGRHAAFLQSLFKMFAGMNRCTCHVAPQW